MRSHTEKGRAFQVLHAGPDALLLPNAWDAGSARLLASLGFAALGTTSLGLANALGRPDDATLLGREEVLANARAIAAATDLPVTADLQNGFGRDPRAAAETIRLAAEAGLAGGSIEDASGDPAEPIYDAALATERVAAAAEAARALPFPFVLTARADAWLLGRRDLDEVVRRLRAYAEAGADVLYAPGLRDLDTIRRVAASVPRPLNVVMSAADPGLTAGDLAAAGVRRISVGGALSRLALGAMLRGAREMRDGRFGWVPDGVPTAELRAVFARSP